MYSAYASVEVLKENQSKLYQFFRKEIGDSIQIIWLDSPEITVIKSKQVNFHLFFHLFYTHI